MLPYQSLFTSFISRPISKKYTQRYCPMRLAKKRKCGVMMRPTLRKPSLPHVRVDVLRVFVAHFLSVINLSLSELHVRGFHAVSALSRGVRIPLRSRVRSTRRGTQAPHSPGEGDFPRSRSPRMPDQTGSFTLSLAPPCLLAFWNHSSCQVSMMYMNRGEEQTVGQSGEEFRNRGS